MYDWANSAFVTTAMAAALPAFAVVEQSAGSSRLSIISLIVFFIVGG